MDVGVRRTTRQMWVANVWHCKFARSILFHLFVTFRGWQSKSSLLGHHLSSAAMIWLRKNWAQKRWSSIHAVAAEISWPQNAFWKHGWQIVANPQGLRRIWQHWVWQDQRCQANVLVHVVSWTGQWSSYMYIYIYTVYGLIWIKWSAQAFFGLSAQHQGKHTADTATLISWYFVILVGSCWRLRGW